MTASFVVYIDESGDEGFQFRAGNGSSEWFVLSAVITEKDSDLDTVKLIDTVRSLIHRPPHQNEPLHFRKLKHEHRIPLIGEIAKARLKTVTVLVHKPSLTNVEIFQQRNHLYFYTARYLLERVSWYCRDHRTAQTLGDGSAEINFSNRGGMKYEELRQYMRDLQSQTSVLNVTIDWSIIRPDQITALATKYMGLQVADAVASGFFFAVRKQYGYSEDRYARMLKPVVYQHRGRYQGYGIKFWPRDYEKQLKHESHLSWLSEVYGFQ